MNSFRRVEEEEESRLPELERVEFTGESIDFPVGSKRKRSFYYNGDNKTTRNDDEEDEDGNGMDGMSNYVKKMRFLLFFLIIFSFRPYS
jgi:hypothetical protein